MNNSEAFDLARAWIEYEKLHKPPAGSFVRHNENDPLFEPVLRLMDLAYDDWPAAMEVCIEIAKQSNEPWILEMLGAGPLEDLLEEHGYDVLNPFLAAAKANPFFTQALRHVWECNDPHVWEQFLKVRDKLASPDIPKY